MDGGRNAGFTLVEVVMVVVIIGVLISISVPVFVAAKAVAEVNACFASQRTLEGDVGTWQAANGGLDPSALAGVVNSTHPLVVDRFVAHPPHCPAAPLPADFNNPTVAEGAYAFGATGRTLVPCAFGAPSAHGHF